MRYSIQPRSANGINAGTKAVKDASSILNKNGYHPFFVGSNYNGNHIYRLLILIYDLTRFFIKAKKDDVFFIQWPYYNYLMPIFYTIVKTRCKKVQLLAHDINSIRNLSSGKWDLRFLKLAELIIVHSEAMKDYLVGMGVDANKMKILSTFDYLTGDKIVLKRHNSNIIAYAGNLEKSLFLQKLSNKNLSIVINCYGKKHKRLSNDLVYKGSFKPENVSAIEGAWGLVWDGDSMDGCKGVYGNYLKFNSPHKLSLYIVAEIPIIIWKEAALAQYVIEKQIGITISSLDEIYSKISSVDSEKYESFIVNLKKESEELRAGQHLQRCLKE